MLQSKSLVVEGKYKVAVFAGILVIATLHLLNSGYRDWNSGADTAYVLALMLLFFSKEKIDDERVQSLKLTAMYVAFAAGWVVTGALRFASYLKVRPATPETSSANDAMFIVLALAFALFHYWRFQDGRSADIGMKDEGRE